ncbi:hypothetical protein ACLOJK_027139 [Asimina triloba]
MATNSTRDAPARGHPLTSSWAPDISSPLSLYLQGQPIPDKFEILGMLVFGPTSDPTRHVVNYNIHMDLRTASEGLKCRAFLATLDDNQRQRPIIVAQLMCIRQGADEPPQDYMSRFNLEARKVPSLLTEVYMPALTQGIRNNELTRNLPPHLHEGDREMTSRAGPATHRVGLPNGCPPPSFEAVHHLRCIAGAPDSVLHHLHRWPAATCRRRALTARQRQQRRRPVHLIHLQSGSRRANDRRHQLPPPSFSIVFSEHDELPPSTTAASMADPASLPLPMRPTIGSVPPLLISDGDQHLTHRDGQIWPWRRDPTPAADPDQPCLLPLATVSSTFVPHRQHDLSHNLPSQIRRSSPTHGDDLTDPIQRLAAAHRQQRSHQWCAVAHAHPTATIYPCPEAASIVCINTTPTSSPTCPCTLAATSISAPIRLLSSNKHAALKFQETSSRNLAANN